MKTCGYIVMKGTKPCAFKNVIGSYRAGLLVPGEPSAFFGKSRDVCRAIVRSECTAARVAGSLIEDWARKNVPSFFDGEPFAVHPLAKQ